ncbi:5-keto-D-gluconate 5-reductase [Citrobacter freundii]|uniref:5-keto-D-gluconate 5-reductase n=1 Tax=Citrobacter freundii TaxID=546 RepID=A0A7G2IM08_CITFR|nr:5-keto-D-gluconate 5-reductase [Citrobacter freundii]
MAEGYRAVGYGFDVTSGEEVACAIAQIEKDVGAIDILINNAGIQRRYPFTEFPEAEWDKVIDVNQKSVFLVSQQVSRYMVQRRRGKIINICSMQSELGRKTITPYAASKGAVKNVNPWHVRGTGGIQYSGQRYCSRLFRYRHDHRAGQR